MRRLFILVLAIGLGACSEENTADAPAHLCATQAVDIGRMVSLPGGVFVKGFAPVYPEEQPSLSLHVSAIDVLAHEVTNDEFAAFVAATSYVTDAERSSAGDSSGGGSAVFIWPTQGAPGHWRLVRGATWRTPAGPGSAISGRGRYPVVHVSLNDARRYAAWAGGRIPTEEEWEYAAWSGLRDRSDPLSGAVGPDGSAIANIWHGAFPFVDAADDGFAGAAPVGCFPPDQNGVHDLIGNVWEWTETPASAGMHVIKGGSHLCAENYCRRYRTAAREDHEVDFSTSHIGFRIVRDPQGPEFN